MSSSFSGMSHPLPEPPSFKPNWHFRDPGDCGREGHVALRIGTTSQWRCVLCDAVTHRDEAPSQWTEIRPGQWAQAPPPIDPAPQGCLWDQLPPEDRGKPIGLSCPCPKCSPQC